MFSNGILFEADISNLFTSYLFFVNRKCSINICDFRDGQRHDMWLSLQNIKIGRLHLAITVVDCAKKVYVFPVKFVMNTKLKC